MLVTAALVAFTCNSAFAGNIALTGHDDDFHVQYDGIGGQPGVQLAAMLSFVRNGSSLPVLVFDSGSELSNALTALGIAHTTVNPDAGVTAAMFDNSLYSAFAVASDYTCSGCDNDATGEANIAAQSAAIDTFLNNGGGILGLAGAYSAGYYAFLPETASAVGGAPSTGYTDTGLGIPAVNGDATHNLFWDPGTHGESSAYVVAEVNAYGNGVIGPGGAVTLICTACTTSGGIITSGVPEPTSVLLFGTVLAALGWTMKKKLSA